jgi:hypothetical protein
LDLNWSDKFNACIDLLSLGGGEPSPIALQCACGDKVDPVRCQDDAWPWVGLMKSGC